MNNILDDAEIHALFPIPVCVFKYKRDPALENFLRNQPIRGIDKIENDDRLLHNRLNYGVVSDNSRMLRTKECYELRTFILEAATAMARDVLNLDIQMEDTISWVSIKRKGEHHTTHTHPNSVLSGVYYFDSNVGRTPISFVKERGVTNSFEMRPKKIYSNSTNSTFSDTDVQLHIEQGNIALFPSYLRHNVVTNMDDKNRYSLAFNLVPKGALGAEDDLTYFQYGEI